MMLADWGPEPPSNDVTGGGSWTCRHFSATVQYRVFAEGRRAGTHGVGRGATPRGDADAGLLLDRRHGARYARRTTHPQLEEKGVMKLRVPRITQASIRPLYAHPAGSSLPPGTADECSRSTTEQRSGVAKKRRLGRGITGEEGPRCDGGKRLHPALDQWALPPFLLAEPAMM